ncbi:MAG: hypothetical protein K2N63_06495 [Lachnospiraceae bacterium]|nr:hypothetical protein [Lachnospiraceae bacterium]
MDSRENKALEQAQEILEKSGKLNITVRRQIWQAMGPLTPRKQDSGVPRILTKPLKKRAMLAIACAKKVMPMWCKCDPDDKRPQNLIKNSLAYLDGKISAADLKTETDSDAIHDFMEFIDEGEIAASAAIAAWKAAVVALEDEADLEPWCLDVTEEEMDSYDWDTAKNACVVWSDAYSDGDIGKCAVREMKFWAWYLEEAAKLLGIQDYRFPTRYIKAFQEKQNPPKPVPKEVTLESFADFLELGEYVYHYKVTEENEDGEDDYYVMSLRLTEDFGVCPVCKKKTYKVEHAGVNRRLDWYDNALPAKGPQLGINQFHFMFRCPDHPNEMIYAPSDVYKNVKSAVKRYIKGEGRVQKLLDELERRKTTKYFKVWGNSLVINGEEFFDLAAIEAHKEELGLVGAGFVDGENKVYGLDLRQFLPIFYIYGRPYGDFIQYWPDQVYKNEDGTLDLITENFQFRCTMEDGWPVYAEIKSIFRIWVKKKEDPALLKVLTKVFNLSAAAAEGAVQNAKSCSSAEWEIKLFTALTKDEAQRVISELKKAGIKCRMLPDCF